VDERLVAEPISDASPGEEPYNSNSDIFSAAKVNKKLLAQNHGKGIYYDNYTKYLSNHKEGPHATPDLTRPSATLSCQAGHYPNIGEWNSW
jgi:hypothetical protein